jgi:S-adenosylmethionine hydrolase
MNSVITLTTDFGVTGGYVAAMKGVILDTNPEARLVDVSHDIPPQNVFQAAFILSTVYRYFPRSAVHLVVVDPGVGTARRIVVLRTPSGTFIGPDNGVLSYAIQEFASGDFVEASGGLRQVKLNPEAHAVEVTNSRFFRQPISDTFHGRDIMAPVAALLSQGFQINAFGETVNRLNMLKLPQPEVLAGGGVTGHVLHIDSFGNVITDVRPEDLPAETGVRIDLGGHLAQGLKHAYADGTGLLAVIGSAGYLEIALKGGSAAALCGARVGDCVKIRAGA